VVGLPLAVANAQPEILDMAAWVSTRPGGHGAVREAISFIWMPGATWTPMGPVAVA
jgi:3-deoxy-D-manno-octulosonate 8-phosphate phosphatase (KDO 8-P phosphatase)